MELCAINPSILWNGKHAYEQVPDAFKFLESMYTASSSHGNTTTYRERCINSQGASYFRVVRMIYE